MANKLSASQAAIKDMQACNMDITMFHGTIKATITLNEELGITNDRVSKKKPVHQAERAGGYYYQKPSLRMKVKVIIRIINPDGTVGCGNDWDFD